MSLLHDILDQDVESLSIIGMAKNTGKTVTLNHLIQLANYQELMLGLTSIGRDGESEDLVTKTEKPLIHLPDKALIAVAKSLLQSSKINFEILDLKLKKSLT